MGGLKLGDPVENHRVYSTIEELILDIEARPLESFGHVYHPIPFPEFEHLTTSTDKRVLADKLEFVETVLSRRRERGLPTERLLDIGANGGFFTFSLARSVRDITAYESDLRYGAIGEFLASTRTSNVKWVSRAFTTADAEVDSWDVALALSVFQWLTEGGAGLVAGLETLSVLSERVSCLIFELGLSAGKSALPAARRNHVSEIYDLLCANTSFPYISYAGARRIWPTRLPWQRWRHIFVCAHDDRYPEAKLALLKHVRV